MNPREILVAMVDDYRAGFWDCQLSPWELVAEFEGVLPGSVTIHDDGEAEVRGRMLSKSRMVGWLAWVKAEHPEAVVANMSWTILIAPAPSACHGKAVA